MSADRCPACTAAVPPGAHWCGLCFADLRPAPAPTPAEPPAAVETPDPTAAAPAVEPIDPLTAPVALLETAAAVPAQGSPVEPVGTSAPADQPAPAAVRGWPCHVCGELVPFDLDVCPIDGVPFLAGAAEEVPALVAKLAPHTSSEGGKVVLMVGVAVVLVTLIVGLLTLLGNVL